MMALKFTKFLFFILIVIVSSCGDLNRSYRDVYDSCIVNLNYFYSDRVKVKDYISELDSFDKYMAITKSGDSGPGYSFSFFGIKNDSGYFLYMDDSMEDVLFLQKKYDSTLRVIDFFSSYNYEREFSLKDVNGVSCSFVSVGYDGEYKNYSLIGRTYDKELINYLYSIDIANINYDKSLKRNEKIDSEIRRDVANSVELSSFRN